MASESIRPGVVKVNGKTGGRSGWRLGLVAMIGVGGRFVEGWVGGERLKDGRQARHVRQSARQASASTVVSRLGLRIKVTPVKQ